MPSTDPWCDSQAGGESLIPLWYLMAVKMPVNTEAFFFYLAALHTWVRHSTNYHGKSYFTM
jgi:hypothetical protein